jgi:hypothetical protein
VVVLERKIKGMKQATLTRFIEERKFPEAASLLQTHIKEAKVIDPRRDDSWGIDADILGYAILEHAGGTAFCTYWQDFLRFFVEELEPVWGHLHKGHIYLRLGIGYLATDLERAAEYLREGLEEDRLVAEQRGRRDPGLDVEETVRDSPAYVTLCTARILDAWSYPSKTFKERFFQDLVPVKFDVIWGPQEVDPRRVERALAKLGGASREQALAAFIELNRVFDQRLSLATMSTLERFLAIVLGDKVPGTSSQPHRWIPPSLTELLASAQRGKTFPDSTIAAVFQMTDILIKVFPLLPKAAIPESLTPRVLSQIAVMVKVLVDLALIRWSERL